MLKKSSFTTSSRRLLFTIFPLLLCAATLCAQQDNTPKPRNLYLAKEADAEKGKSGAKVRILLKRGTEDERYVAPTETFYSGDKIKLAFDINFSGHIALLNTGSSGKVTMLYPYVGADSKIEPSATEQFIPANRKDWIAFDNTDGIEQITVVFSLKPIDSIAKVIESSGQTGTTATVGGALYTTTSAESQTMLRSLNTNSLKRSKSRDLSIETVKDDATYVVAETSLINEPTAFVITLKHESR